MGSRIHAPLNPALSKADNRYLKTAHGRDVDKDHGPLCGFSHGGQLAGRSSEEAKRLNRSNHDLCRHEGKCPGSAPKDSKTMVYDGNHWK